jgi:flagellar biogenesis protein FliO
MFGFSFSKLLIVLGVILVVVYVWGRKGRKVFGGSSKRESLGEETLSLCKECGCYHVKGSPCKEEG